MVCHGSGQNLVIANSSTGISQSVNCPNKSNRALLAMIAWTPSSVTISAISYGGTNLTLVSSTDVTNSNGVTVRTAIYGLVAPTVGSNTFVLTPSGTVDLSVQLCFLYNVNQSTPFSAGATATGNAIAPNNLTISGSSNVEDMVYDVLGFLTPGSIISNDGTSGQPQSWLSAYMSRVGGPFQLVTECGYANGSETLAYQTLDGSTHQYAWSACLVTGISGNTEYYNINWDNSTDDNSACDVSTFNFDFYEVGDVATVQNTYYLFGAPAAEFSSTTYGAPNAAREWFHAPELYTTYWIMFNTIPSDGWRNVIWQGTYSGNGDIMVDIDTNGTFRLKIDGTVRTNTTFAATVGVWVKVSIHHKVAGASSDYTISINDGQETHSYNYNIATTNINLIQVGFSNDATTGDLFVDNMTADAAAYLADPYHIMNVATVIPRGSPKPAQKTPSEWGTSLVNNSSTSNAATFNSASYNVTANALMTAWIMRSGTTVPNPATLAGNACTWTMLKHLPVGSVGCLDMFIARSATAANGTLRITDAGTSRPTGCIWMVQKWPNAFIASPTDNGSSAIVQVQTTVGTAVTSGTITMNAFGTHRSWSSIAAGWGLNSVANVLSPKYGYQAIGTFGYSTPSTSAMVEYKVQGQNPAASWTSSTAGGGIAVEIQGPVVHNRTATKILNAFKAIVGWVKSGGGGATVRSVVAYLTSHDSVVRRNSLKRYAKVILSSGRTVRYTRSLIRKLSLSVVRASTVRRLQSYIRKSTSGRSLSFSVKRIGSYIRKVSDSVKIAFNVVQSKTGSTLHTVSVATQIALKYVVNRRASYLRTSKTIDSIGFSVKRVASYICKVVVVKPLSLIASRLKGYRRLLVLQNTATLAVSRVSSRLRKATDAIAIGFSAKRSVSYIRRIATAIVRTTKAVYAKSGGATARTISLVISGTMRVSRSARYLRKVVVFLPPYPAVSRIARYLRKVATSRTGSFSIRRSMVRVRAILSARSSAFVVRRRTSYLRAVSTLTSSAFSVRRFGKYIRRALLVATVRALVGMSRFTGEPILLRIIASLNAKIAYLTNSNQKTSFTSSSNTKDNYKT